MSQLQRDQGLQLDRTELLANALAHLVLTVQQLNTLPDSMKVNCLSPLLSPLGPCPAAVAEIQQALLVCSAGRARESLQLQQPCSVTVLPTVLLTRARCLQTILFAGRRLSDRVILLLQNVFCAKHLKGYAGTSAVYAVAKVNAALQQLGIHHLAERRAHIGEQARHTGSNASIRGWTCLGHPCTACPVSSLGAALYRIV